MRQLAFALAVLAASSGGVGTAGCKHANGGSAKLEGHWQGTRADGIDPAAQDAANAFATQTEIVARKNTIIVSTPQARGQQGTYVVDDENKTTVVLHTDKDGPDAKETFSFSEDGETMTWRLGEGRSIVFQKLKN